MPTSPEPKGKYQHIQTSILIYTAPSRKIKDTNQPEQIRNNSFGNNERSHGK